MDSERVNHKGRNNPHYITAQLSWLLQNFSPIMPHCFVSILYIYQMKTPATSIYSPRAQTLKEKRFHTREAILRAEGSILVDINKHNIITDVQLCGRR